MNNLINLLGITMVCLGVFLLLIGSIGVVRLPDFFCRTHATTKNDTLGIMFSLGGFAVYEGISLNSLKLFTAMVFVGLAYPVGSHVLMNVAAQCRFGKKLVDLRKSQEQDIE